MTDTNQEVRETPEALTFTYTNWRGETAERRVRADTIRIGWGSNQWHPEPQWIMTAWDLDKSRFREFAWKDIALASAPPPAVPDAVGVRVKGLTWEPRIVGKYDYFDLVADCFGGAVRYGIHFARGDAPNYLYRGNSLIGSFASVDEAKLEALADFKARALSSIEPTPSPEPQASNAGAVEEAFLRLCEEIGIPATAGAYLEYRTRAALSTPEPQTGERDGEESPYTWVKTQRVPGTSYVGGSLMLLAEDGHCVGTVKVMMGEGATEIDVYRALQTAGNPAKLQRFIRAARNGEQEANDRAETAERRLAEVAERAREDERDRLYAKALAQNGGCHNQISGWLHAKGATMPSFRAALRAKPEAQAIVGKEAGE